jgi:hypothetical protein
MFLALRETFLRFLACALAFVSGSATSQSFSLCEKLSFAFWLAPWLLRLALQRVIFSRFQLASQWFYLFVSSAKFFGRSCVR